MVQLDTTPSRDACSPGSLQLAIPALSAALTGSQVGPFWNGLREQLSGFGFQAEFMYLTQDGLAYNNPFA
jgi:hypothetical protein